MALRQGYYWPTMHEITKDMVRSCDKCQRFAKVTLTPPSEANKMTSPWPLIVSGVNLIGPMPIKRARGNMS